MLIEKLINQVKALDLNLKGKTILTEAASGAYIVTPLLAAIAGAKVFAFSKTTSYGTVDDIFTNTQQLIDQYKQSKLDITFIKELTPEIIACVDIITNSGHLRPLDKSKLQFAKDGLVIPLMYEAWELRDADIDLNYIRSRDFKIGATNERHPNIDVFNYLGDMAVKQIFDAGICLYDNDFLLLCNNDFGPYIAKTLSKLCSNLGVIDLDSNKVKYQLDEIDWIGGFPNFKIPEKYKKSEAIIFTAYPFDQKWIGENSIISILDIKNQVINPYVLRFCGDIDCLSFDLNQLKYFPKNVGSGHMGVLPSDIGFDPIIRLQSGGLKVGELLLNNDKMFNNYNLLEIIE
jgi:hypothetical protein